MSILSKFLCLPPHKTRGLQSFALHKRGTRASFALLLALAPLQGHAAEKTLLAFGDSLTQGYGLPDGQGLVPQLQAWLNAHGADVTIINGGVSGDTTAGGRARIDWSLTPDVDAVMVALGGNDILRGLAPAQAKANLDAILKAVTDKDLPVLLAGVPVPGNYGTSYQTEFRAIYPDLAAEYDAVLVPDLLAPLAAAQQDDTKRADYLQPDGLHPSAKGVALVVEALGPQVLDLLDQVE
ncbi:arylesterase [Thioclava sp. GXIMD4215]|uniref:arylesterase n=1 Tax=Thioclava sp. GXIMD4215 TaxID=3131928 RepID=UPI003253155D